MLFNMSASFRNATVTELQGVGGNTTFRETNGSGGIVSHLHGGVWSWQFLLTMLLLLVTYDQGKMSQYNSDTCFIPD
jgi:hypothetical protein